MLSVAEFTAMALVFLAVLRDGSCLSISGLSSSVPILECFPPCLNGGVCNPETKQCLCPSEYEGEDCSKLVDQCSLSPCAPGEDCVNNRFHIKGYRCVKNPCCSNPCQEGEQCVIRRGRHVCEANPCGNQTCYNGGTCTFSRNPGRCETTISCQCPPPFDPHSLCYKVRGCHPTLKPCQNGGTCTDEHQCTCAPSYEGMHCERKTTVLSF